MAMQGLQEEGAQKCGSFDVRQTTWGREEPQICHRISWLFSSWGVSVFPLRIASGVFQVAFLACLVLVVLALPPLPPGCCHSCLLLPSHQAFSHPDPLAPEQRIAVSHWCLEAEDLVGLGPGGEGRQATARQPAPRALQEPFLPAAPHEELLQAPSLSHKCQHPARRRRCGRRRPQGRGGAAQPHQKTYLGL